MERKSAIEKLKRITNFTGKWLVILFLSYMALVLIYMIGVVIYALINGKLGWLWSNLMGI
jgi:hypothetical protein